MNPTTQLSPVKTLTVPSLLIRPVASNNEIVEAWDKYTELKSKLLSATDYQLISGKQFIKKSGWRKLQTAFGISDELIKEEKKESGKQFTYEVTVKLISPNGRFSFGIGSCSSTERNFAHPEHDVRSTAHTRAKNRGISDLIGGEVSAEEIKTPTAYSVVNSEEKDTQTNNSYSESHGWGREYEANKITERQRNLLIDLFQSIDDETERQAQLDSLESLSKSDASEMISELINAKKVNNY